jgi:hypothetical protein
MVNFKIMTHHVLRVSCKTARLRACALSDLGPLLQMAAHRASRSRPSPPIDRAMLALACAVAAAAVLAAAGGGVRTHALHDHDHGDFRVNSEKGTAPVVKRTLLSSLAPTLLVGSVRPDVWIPQFKVPGQDAPTTGRRVHIVAPINASVCDADLASVSFREICCPHHGCHAPACVTGAALPTHSDRTCACVRIQKA